MKTEIRVEGLAELRAAFGQVLSQRRANAALATALSRTASDVRQAVRAQMPGIFDRPTPYTLNSLYVKGATAHKLEAEVGFKDDRATSKAGIPATYYLTPNVEGGARRNKRFERVLQMAGILPEGWFAVPGAGARLDAYGNMSLGQIIQVLSQLRLTMLAGSTRNMAFGAKSIAAQRKAGGRFFAVRPGGGGRLAPGVYQREFYGRNITPVMIFVRRAQYRARFDFAGIVQREAAARGPAHAWRAFDEQLARLLTK